MPGAEYVYADKRTVVLKADEELVPYTYRVFPPLKRSVGRLDQLPTAAVGVNDE